MTHLEGKRSYVPDCDWLFHWGFPEQLPAVSSDSPKDMQLRKYAYPCARFASTRLRELALVTLDLGKLADIAMACLDDSRSSTGYWWEMLSLHFLQVEPSHHA